MNQVSQKGLLKKVRRLNQSNNSFFLCFLIYNDQLQNLKSHPCLIIICLIYYNQFQCLTNHETIDIYKEKVKSIKNFHISLGISLLHQLQAWNNIYRLLRHRNLKGAIARSHSQNILFGLKISKKKICINLLIII